VLTPLALVLITIEIMDLIFAIDSIPAVLAITRDTFIVYTSNICAILGLRSLYFLLANLVTRFIYLRIGLAIILCFVGSKMLAEPWFSMPSWVSLLVIAAILAVSTIASLIATNGRPGSPVR
jgi:tellurite resistance protein TerC